MHNGKTVILSGGSKGLGYYIVNHLLSKGYNVATFSRTKTDLVSELINNKNFFWKSVNIESREEVSAFYQNVLDNFGGVDVLINNTTYLFEGLLAFSHTPKIQKSISINFEGPIHLTKLCIPSMIKKKNGIILNISSINAIRGHKGVSIYSATKAGIDGMMKSLARELGPMNIRVNSVSPGFFETELVSYLSEERKKQILKRTPLGRIAKISDIANMILFLISPEASFITGQNIIIDGGMTC